MRILTLLLTKVYYELKPDDVSHIHYNSNIYRKGLERKNSSDATFVH